MTEIITVVNDDGTVENIESNEVREIPIDTPWDSYVEKRKAEYPNLLDYVDAVVKGDEAQKQAYIDACLAVKAKYPKQSQEGA